MLAENSNNTTIVLKGLDVISLKLEIRIKKANSSINTPNICAINEGAIILLILIIFN